MSARRFPQGGAGGSAVCVNGGLGGRDSKYDHSRINPLKLLARTFLLSPLLAAAACAPAASPNQTPQARQAANAAHQPSPATPAPSTPINPTYQRLFGSEAWSVGTMVVPATGGRVCGASAWGPAETFGLSIVSHGVDNVSVSFTNDAWAMPVETEKVVSVRAAGEVFRVHALGGEDSVSLQLFRLPDRGRSMVRAIANADLVTLSVPSGETLTVRTTGARPALEALAACETRFFQTRLVASALVPNGLRNPMASR